MTHRARTTGRPRGPVRVVLADDSTAVRRNLIDMLAHLDHVCVVEQAGDAACAVAAVRQHRPDVVVLDISMPGGNGIDALQQIKSDCPEAQVIMLTNHSNDFYRKRCLGAGASFFFDKSHEFEKVSEVLEQQE